MNFNGQPNKFFCNIILGKCDLHIKLDILNPLNIYILSNGLKNESCNPFLQNFKILKFLYDLEFHRVHPMNMYFHRRGACFCCKKNLKSLVWLYAFLLIVFLKMHFRHLIILIYKTQNEIYIISQLFKNIWIQGDIILFIGIQQSITIMIM
jgi:hypothetical protein